MNLEEELRQALRRKEPASGFAERVNARLRPPWWRRPAYRALAAVLVIATLAGGMRLHAQRARGERAKQQVILALRVAGAKLNQAQERAWELGQNH